MFTVELTVTNAFGRTDTTTPNITVAPNAVPVPSFTMSPATPNSCDIVTFTSTSTDDDTIVATSWMIGDTSYSGTMVQVKVCGPETAVLLGVTDSIGQYAEITMDIPVAGSDRVTVPVGSDLQATANAACPKDTLGLAAGTYLGGFTLSTVHLEGAGAGVTVIDGASESG